MGIPRYLVEFMLRYAKQCDTTLFEVGKDAAMVGLWTGTW